MNQPFSRKPVVSRFYNYISFRGDRVIKGAPKDRFKNEIAWFKEAKKRIPDNIPYIYNYNKEIKNPNDKGKLRYYEMQAIDGDNLYLWTMVNKGLAFQAFNKLIKLANFFHKESYSVNTKDIYEMYYLKPQKSIAGFINEKQIDVDTLIINNQKMKNPLFLLETIYRQLEKSLINTKYSFIHGDLTMGNTLIDKEGKLFLIDPRGKFGNTSIYGDVRYDVAKMYFSVFGNFESVSNGKFDYAQDKLKQNSHFYKIQDCGFSSYEKKMLNLFGEKTEIIKFIHATIWLSLMPHVLNNQQFCAFCHGVYLLNLLS